jgi:signal transduction histidine kinase
MRENMRLRPRRNGHSFWPRLPRRTIRVRLAVLFFAVFLASGIVLLAVTVAVWQGRTQNVTVGPVRAGGSRNPAIGITQHSSDRHELLIASALALAVTGMLSLAIGWLVAGRFLRPLRTITATTKEISATNLHERLRLAGPDDELKELADTFDELLDRLERSFGFERQFIANASHELRTPLAAMRTSLDVAMAKPGPVPPHVGTLDDRLRRELDQVDRLLESFLTLAHSQQGPPADQTTVSLAGLTHGAIERRADAIAAIGLAVEEEASPNTWISGNETLVARMIENVIDNAIDHNPPGGYVRVITAVEDERVSLVVENGGPVLDPDKVKQLTQPFRRIDAARTGSDKGVGLGLAIVSSIVDVHAGTLDLEARPGGGLRVAITLPLAIPPAAGKRA